MKGEKLKKMSVSCLTKYKTLTFSKNWLKGKSKPYTLKPQF